MGDQEKTRPCSRQCSAQLPPPPPASQSGRDRQRDNNVSSVGHFVIEYARLFWLGFLHAGYHFKELKQSFLFRFRTLGGCFSEFSFEWLLKLVESFVAIIYVGSDSAYFDRQSKENSLRQPPRFCNAKKGLFKLFKMPYSKSKSEQKRSFKLKKKSGAVRTFFVIVNVGIWSPDFLLNLNLRFCSDFDLEYGILKSLNRPFLALQNLGWCLSEFLFDFDSKWADKSRHLRSKNVRMSPSFESRSNENSLRQPARFGNAKKPLLMSFKMPYSK